MTAPVPEMVAFMQKKGMPTAPPCQVIYDSITPMSRLTCRNLVDFEPQAHATCLRLTFDQTQDAVWSER